MRQLALLTTSAFAFAALSFSPAAAEEGMWTFENFPTARVQACAKFCGTSVERVFCLICIRQRIGADQLALHF
jgi:hypothetical protein